MNCKTLIKQRHATELELTPFDNSRLVSLCGRFDEHIKLIEKRLNVEILNRGNKFQILGTKKTVQSATDILENLYKQTLSSEELTLNSVHLAIKQFTNDSAKKEHIVSDKTKSLSIHTSEVNIRPRSSHQSQYVKNIMANDITFGVGPAGTGKTFLAVACAVQALEQHKVSRILLVRPAVEAGERLGFLPGDLTQKIDPYLRPLYDALYEMMGCDMVMKLLEQQVIEIAPLAYMRGRTLNDAFIILDESQNTTVEQMKMFLTRIGFSSKAVITGDVTQVDLPRGANSGLKHAIHVLKDIPHISFTHFDSKDVVRHPVVQQIIDAYGKFGKNRDQDEH